MYREEQGQLRSAVVVQLTVHGAGQDAQQGEQHEAHRRPRAGAEAVEEEGPAEEARQHQVGAAREEHHCEERHEAHGLSEELGLALLLEHRAEAPERQVLQVLAHQALAQEARPPELDQEPPQPQLVLGHRPKREVQREEAAHRDGQGTNPIVLRLSQEVHVAIQLQELLGSPFRLRRVQQLIVGNIKLIVEELQFGHNVFGVGEIPAESAYGGELFVIFGLVV